MITEELNICPICGGKPEIIGHFMKGVANRYIFFVRCSQCRYRPHHNEFKKRCNAIKGWNIKTSE